MAHRPVLLGSVSRLNRDVEQMADGQNSDPGIDRDHRSKVPASC